MENSTPIITWFAGASWINASLEQEIKLAKPWYNVGIPPCFYVDSDIDVQHFLHSEWDR